MIKLLAFAFGDSFEIVVGSTREGVSLSYEAFFHRFDPTNN